MTSVYLVLSALTFANTNGPTIGVADPSRIVHVDGLVFRDANRNGLLEPYEDWRLTPEERARDFRHTDGSATPDTNRNDDSAETF